MGMIQFSNTKNEEKVNIFDFIITNIAYFKSDYFEIAKNLEIFTIFKRVPIIGETDPGKLIKSTMDEMLQTLDPYGNYLSLK